MEATSQNNTRRNKYHMKKAILAVSALIVIGFFVGSLTACKYIQHVVPEVAAYEALPVAPPTPDEEVS